MSFAEVQAEHTLRWAMVCQFRYHGENAADKHTKPFWKCSECIRNLAENGLTGDAVVRAMREYPEVGR